MTRWILIRHGESTANAERWLAGWVDVPLTPKGQAQAAALAPALAGERIPRVFASDLRRAHDTARGALAGRAYGIRAVPDLRERTLGDWTGLRDDEARRTGRRQALDDLRFRPPGGESLLDVARRVLPFLHRVDDGTPALVVAHGGLLRAIWALHLGDVAPERVGLLPMPNARPMILELPRGRWGALLGGLP